MIVSSSAIRIFTAAILPGSCREHDLCTRSTVGRQREASLELVADQGIDDRQAGSVRSAARAFALVTDREDDVAVAPPELDAHRAGAVLERVLEQLGEDE